MRRLYERLRWVSRLYRWLAFLAVLFAFGMGARLMLVSRRIAAMRRQAAEVFYQMKAMELEVARLTADAPQRRGYLYRRATLEEDYEEWVRRLDENSRGPADERAIRAAVARLGETPVLATRAFVRDARDRVAAWRRTPDFGRILRDTYDRKARIESVLVATGLPSDLVWVAYQESRFDPRAVGPRTRFGIAKGMWQFMPPTARQYGLRTGPLLGARRFDPADERHDVERSTDAAARYMRDLYMLDAQGSGLLVMASYNFGQTRLLRLLRSLPATPQDRNFWTLMAQHRDQIPDETYGYVVGIVAAAAVVAEPSAFAR